MFELIEPLNFQEIGSEFIVSGWVPISWLIRTDSSKDNRLFTEFIDINCKIFMGGSIDVNPEVIDNRQYFSQTAELSWLNVSWIEKSEGRIVIKLYGQDENRQHMYVPLVVKEFEEHGDAVAETIEKHSRVGETIEQFVRDLQEFNKELASIQDSRDQKDKIFENLNSNKYVYPTDRKLVMDIYNLFEGSDDIYENYLYSDEDKREYELNKKYEAALKWKGRRLKIFVGKINGFEFRLHTDDHDKHFHVIHAEKGINARFTFPEIELLNYKLCRNTISSKEKKRIQEYFNVPDNFKKLEFEISRRDENR